MNLAKNVLQRMIIGYQKKKMQEYYESLGEGRSPQQIIVRPIVQQPVVQVPPPVFQPIVQPVMQPPVMQPATAQQSAQPPAKEPERTTERREVILQPIVRPIIQPVVRPAEISLNIRQPESQAQQPTIPQSVQAQQPLPRQQTTIIQPVAATRYPSLVPYPMPVMQQPVVIQPQLSGPRAQAQIQAQEQGQGRPKQDITQIFNIEGGLQIPSLQIKDGSSEGKERSKYEPLKITVPIAKSEVVPMKRIAYPLVPRNPKENEPIMAYAKIYWDAKENRYVYEVVEPEVSEELKATINKVKELLEEKLDIDFSKLKLTEASDFLKKQISNILVNYEIKMTEEERLKLEYFIERDYMGLGRIEPLMQDPQIEDISCDGIGTPLFIFHRNPQIGSIITNIIFNNADELDSFITRLAQLSGKSISVAQPLLDGALPDGSRLQATLATDIARKGSNFTIRKFTEEPLTPIHLLNYNTIDVKSLAYLWMAVDYGRSILVSGGTASGKTSFLNALSLFIRPDKKIVSIEDTAELRLPHPHWVPGVARTSISSGLEGEIDMFTLLKESMRQRPDYIIVGEVRGPEASVLFQQMATGHPSYATIHAENMDKLTNRLTTAPISLPKTLVGSLDLIVFMLRVRYKDKFVRRVSEIIEMVDFDPDNPRPTVNRVFKWESMNDKFSAEGRSLLLKKIGDLTGISEQEILDEVERRMVVLEWMRRKNVTDYQDFYKIINMYYYSPNKVLAGITGEA